MAAPPATSHNAGQDGSSTVGETHVISGDSGGVSLVTAHLSEQRHVVAEPASPPIVAGEGITPRSNVSSPCCEPVVAAAPRRSAGHASQAIPRVRRSTRSSSLVRQIYFSPAASPPRLSAALRGRGRAARSTSSGGAGRSGSAPPIGSTIRQSAMSWLTRGVRSQLVNEHVAGGSEQGDSSNHNGGSAAEYQPDVRGNHEGPSSPGVAVDEPRIAPPPSHTE